MLSGCQRWCREYWATGVPMLADTGLLPHRERIPSVQRLESLPTSTNASIASSSFPPSQHWNRVGDAGQGHRIIVRSDHRCSSLTVSRGAITPSRARRPADDNRRQVGTVQVLGDGSQTTLFTGIVISQPANGAAKTVITVAAGSPEGFDLRNPTCTDHNGYQNQLTELR